MLSPAAIRVPGNVDIDRSIYGHSTFAHRRFQRPDCTYFRNPPICRKLLITRNKSRRDASVNHRIPQPSACGMRGGCDVVKLISKPELAHQHLLWTSELAGRPLEHPSDPPLCQRLIPTIAAPPAHVLGAARARVLSPGYPARLPRGLLPWTLDCASSLAPGHAAAHRAAPTLGFHQGWGLLPRSGALLTLAPASSRGVFHRRRDVIARTRRRSRRKAQDQRFTV